jgi:ABC-type polysaccharide/polyol phosphate export permease
VSAATTGTARAAAPELVLDGRPEPMGRYLRSLWLSRGLVRTLARKDFFVRYRRASLGVLWAVGLPLLQALVLTVIFTHDIKIRSGTGSYGAFILAGMVPWSYFAGSVNAASTAVVDGSGMASRIYFPRAVLPLIPVVSNLYSLAISLVILVCVCLALRVHLGVAVLMLVPAVLLLTLLAAAFALVNSALHVYFRDMKFLVQAMFTVWLYVTPVIYPLHLAPASLRTALLVNPITGVVEMFRAATVGADPGWESSVAATAVAVAVIGGAAVLLHRRFDRLFTDLL